MARAVLYQNNKFELVKRPVPEAEPGRVIVHITLRPLNPVDVGFVTRVAAQIGGPAVPGYEGFGIVHSVGEGVAGLKPGQRVVPFFADLAEEGNGSWQEYVSVRRDRVWAIPDSISDEAAAQFVINPWTAYGLLDDLKVPKGEYLLQSAAGSVLGRLVIQLAKHFGMKTINIVRRSEQKEELKALGADEVISSKDEDVVARVKGITNSKLAYGAIDAIGGTFTQTVCACVRSGGEVLVYGVMSGTYNATAGTMDLFRGVRLTGYNLSNTWEDEEKRKVYVREVSKLLEEKVIQPFAGEKFDLADFETAMRKSKEDGRGGKVLLTSS